MDVVVGPLGTRQPSFIFPPLSSSGGKPPYRPPFTASPKIPTSVVCLRQAPNLAGNDSCGI